MHFGLTSAVGAGRVQGIQCLPYLAYIDVRAFDHNLADSPFATSYNKCLVVGTTAHEN